MKKIKFCLLLIILLILLTYSISKIIKWKKDNNIIQNEMDLINDKVEITIIDNNDNEINNSNIYVDYAKMDLIDVDFSNLRDINPDIRGWIKVKGTNINHPFVQYKNNEYYLNHSFTKEKNEAGWIFMDYRNNIKDLDDNTIIYGHNRLNKAMFGTLNNLLKKDWLNNKENYIINISNENNNSLWKIFSVYKISTTNDYLITNFNTEIEKQIFIRNIINRSQYDFKTDVTTNDKILTLSTCDGSKRKLVVHAKLIKIQSKESK